MCQLFRGKDDSISGELLIDRRFGEKGLTSVRGIGDLIWKKKILRKSNMHVRGSRWVWNNSYVHLKLLCWIGNFDKIYTAVGSF